jgi:hypothetical protein
MCSGSWSRTSNHPGQSRVANHRWSPPGMEPPTRLERVTCPLQEGRSASDELRRRAGEAVCPVRFERTLSAYSAPRLLPLVYEHVEPSPGADPGLLPYGGRVTSRVRRHCCRARIRTLTPVAQNHVACLVSRPGIKCGWGDSNSQTTCFEQARWASSHHTRVVRREGHDPPTP